MCGINGFILDHAFTIEKADTILRTMNSNIIHRGPDSDGFFIESSNQFQIGMAMRRLSIIDLNTGEQPIYNEDKSLVIVFNGEIYNYRELKQGLIDEGVSFKTKTDTEVILKLYEKQGIKAFALLDGAFGLSIYDKKINKVYIARDFFGEKPIYYTQQPGHFYWASELKSIISILEQKPAIDSNALNLYFQLTYIPAPYTIYKNIYKLKANHLIEFDCSNHSFAIKEIEQEKAPFAGLISFDEAKKKTFEYVMNSVESRSVSDVPIGTFLSGGVDSSIVSWCLSNQSDTKIDTFSVGFEKKSFDETEKSRAIAQLIKSNHHEFIITENDLKKNLHEVLINFDEPFGDSSAVASFIVAKESSKFIKVALSGDGADEIFGGYNKYLMGKLNNYYTRAIPQKLHNKLLPLINNITNTEEDIRGVQFKLNRLFKSINYGTDSYYNIISLGFQNNELSKILNPESVNIAAIDFYKQIRYQSKKNSLIQYREIDLNLSLEGDMLVKVDRTSMFASLECRSPFLNKALWDFTNTLPEKYLLNGWNKKYLLKEAFKKHFPKGFLDKPKKGFNVPVGDWLKKELKNELLAYTDYKSIKKQNIFNYDFIRVLVDDHIQGKVDNTFRIWTFFCFQKWYFNTYEETHDFQS